MRGRGFFGGVGWGGVLLCVGGLVVGGCGGAGVVRQETVVFGTRVAVTVVGVPAARAHAAVGAVFARFEEMHARFHAWRPGELQRLNARIAVGALPVTVSAPMAAMVAQGRRFFLASEGLFNPAVGEVVRLWGFHSDVPRAVPPAAAEVAAALAGADMEAVRVSLSAEGAYVVAAAPRGGRLDFGGMAKGVALDEAREILRAHGVVNALVDVGGDILALGRRGGREWRVALAPDAFGEGRVLALRSGEAVATSGGSARFWVYEGRRYSHIIDPRTGWPAVRAVTATAVAAGAEAGAASDALATALTLADEAAVARLMRAFGVTLAWREGGAPSDAMRRRLAEG